MEFNLTKKQVKRTGQWLMPPPEGKTICYEEPLHHQLLPKLMQAIQATDWPRQFHGYYYQLKTNHGLVHEEVPASEYYKIAHRAMQQKYHAAVLTLESIEALTSSLAETYPQRRGHVHTTSQPKLCFTHELYALRRDFASLLFLQRSLLDEFASLVQFLPGPRSRQFSSFADLMTKCIGDNPPMEIPTDLQVHMRDNSGWFWRMRDIRDYIAHHRFVHVHLVESPEGGLRFFIHHRLDMLELSREFMAGLNAMLASIDNAFARRVAGA